MTKLKDKVAVITGGNSGIGLATAREFLAQGAKVVITGRRKAAIDEAVRELGDGATGVLADTADLQQIDALVEKVKALYNKVDVLFINAGIGQFFPIEYATEQQFDQIMNVNYKGAYFTLSKFLPLLEDGASVILLSSISATSGMANSSVYGGSKAALNSLAKVASIELAPRKIRVNSVSPGPIDTPIMGKTGLDASAIEQFAGAMREQVPLKRFGISSEVAKLVTFLASDEAAFITGSDYVIDGGIIVNAVL
ncbi:MAG TPA: SDR family oxidoreductase [Dinghuibacter sp.]|uniref:SDR family oxidoreductase n=1 Tax=Dinghuibacter sp. TaxID=2024697 RepID=UPI002B8B08B7|nr:SDR family oxidoreductase [Dinghuibacter sp.]HTJ12514.1 SDR family oxidoreductase [Dinghuibacter sp.]